MYFMGSLYKADTFWLTKEMVVQNLVSLCIVVFYKVGHLFESLSRELVGVL